MSDNWTSEAIRDQMDKEADEALDRDIDAEVRKDEDPRPFETEALAKLPATMIRGMLAALAKQPELTNVEPFWHLCLASFGKSKGSYELELYDERSGLETSLPFPVADFQGCYELLQRLVKRGDEVKLHHVGDERFDALVLWVKG